MILGTAFLALIVCVSLDAQTQHLQGSVQVDEPYLHPLGRGLILVVTTASIEVQAVPYKPQGNNFAECITQPYHGPNAIYLDAWQFDPKRKSALLTRHRGFQFTLNAADNKTACDELSIALNSPTTVGENGILILGTPGYQPPPHGIGIITLSKIRLTQPASAKDTKIESFSFVADVTLPPIMMAIQK
jgi:hypothetical protein